MTFSTERERVLHLLRDEWASAEWLLQEFRGLFSDSERLSMLNCIAGPLLVLVKEVLQENLLLRVARLTDPLRTGAHANLTLRQVPALFDDEPEKRRELDQQVQAAVEAAAFARDRRNRQIGHKDLRHLMATHAKPLERASLQQVDAALAAAHRVLDTIAGYEQACLVRRDTGSDAADALLYRTLRLVEAVQFIDGLIDPDGASGYTDHEQANVFLDKLGYEPDRRSYELVVELRAVARLFPRQDLTIPLRAKLSRRRRSQATLP